MGPLRWCWLVVAAPLLLVGCGDSSGNRPETMTIAILRAVASDDAVPHAEFRAELRTAGFVEGGNLRIVPGDGRAIPDPQDAQAAVERWQREGLDLVVAMSSGGAEVAQRTAPDIPVLFVSNDPTRSAWSTTSGDQRVPEPG